MKEHKKPTFLLINLNTEDVIVTSGNTETGIFGAAADDSWKWPSK